MATHYKKHLELEFAKKKRELDAKIAEIETVAEKGEEIPAELKDAMNSLFVRCQEIKNDINNLTGLEDIDAFSKGEQKNAFVPAGQPRILSPGEAFVSSDAYKSMIQGGKPIQGMSASVEAKGFLLGGREQKATFDSTDTGLTSGLPYVGGIVMVQQRRLTIRDLLAVGQTTLNSIPYIAETSFTNAATAVAEEGLKPEATFVTEDRTAPVKKIAVIGRVTDEMFADFPMMRDYVNQRLRFMVELTEENQLLNGSGSGANIQGITTTTGVQTQAIGSDTMADAIHKAITKVRFTGFYEPDGVVIHPTDWEAMKLAKDSNGQYYGGGPFSGAYGNGAYPTAERLWGLPVVVTPAIAVGDPLVGAFKMGAQIWQREGITVATTDTDGEDWRYNRIAVRVEERLALTVYRPTAFCQVITT